jgi:hypothetical protein
MKPILSILRNIGIIVWPKLYEQWRSIALLVVIVVSPHSFATTIIVLLHNDEIWIAADSKEGNPNGDVRYRCKIISGGNFYFGAATYIYDDDASGFSIPKLIGQIKSDGRTLEDTVKAFVETAKRPVAEELVFMRKVDPKYFDRHSVDPGRSECREDCVRWH